MRRLNPESALLLLGVALFATLLFKHISYPVLWQDEGETAVFAERVLEYGYPKVHGPRNVLYEFGGNVAVGVKESVDAYIGTTWGHFYFAVPGALWAGAVEDRYAKTARLRIPFALAGAVGIGLWVLALTPVFRGAPRKARLFAGLFFLLAAVSVSLLLHLREVRYYPLLVLLCGALAVVEIRHRLIPAPSPWRRAAIATLLLVCVFHTFFAAYFILALVLALDALLASARSDDRMRVLLTEGSPVLASAVLVAPALVFFETFAVANAFRANLGLTLGGYAENLGFFVRHFWQHELLAPAIFCRLALLATAAAARRRGLPPVVAPERAVASRIVCFVILWVAVTCANPLVYERYFVPVVPAVIGIFLLDSFALVRVVAQWERAARRGLAVATVVAIGAVFAVTSGPRSADVRGRIAEISEPYRGPLDFVIDRIAGETPRTADLVIATNYANHPLMYYLGSHVIVGTNLNNIVAERALEPDIVIPRRRWPRGRAELRDFLARGNFRREALPVRDVHFNNIPALTRSPSTPDVHRFRTPAVSPDSPEGGLEVYWRQPAGGPPADGKAGRSGE
jgi:hypothetical protein